MTDESLHAPLPDHAKALLERNAYLTLSTIGADGQPWTSPIYMAADGLTDFYWVSNQASLHSVNVEAHPEVSLVVFDSTVPAYHGRALYAVGTAAVVDESELEHGLRVYPGPPSRGGSVMTLEDVTGESPVPAVSRSGQPGLGPVPTRAPAALPAPRSRRGPPRTGPPLNLGAPG